MVIPANDNSMPMPWCDRCECYHHRSARHIRSGALRRWMKIGALSLLIFAVLMVLNQWSFAP